MNAEGAGDGTDEGCEQDPGKAAHVNNQLELIGLVHPDAGLIDTGERGQLLCPESRVNFFLGLHVFCAHGHDFGTEGQDITGLSQGKDIFADQLRLILPDLHKVGLDRETVIFAAILPGQRTAVKVGDAVLLPTLLIQIPGSDNAHRRTSFEFTSLRSLLPKSKIWTAAQQFIIIICHQ